METYRARRAAEVRERGRTLRRDQTPAERVLWEALRDRRLDHLKFRRQVPMDIFVLDFYCRDLKLVVELDGGIHADPAQVAHDQNRDAYLQSQGCTILRFPNEAIRTDLSNVLQKIAQAAAKLQAPRPDPSRSHNSPSG
jgi:very-short-patch-repair endonuclease